MNQQHTHHQFGGEGRTPPALAAGAWCREVDLRSKGGEVDILLHHLKRITKLVELGFTLLVGKQTGLDYENLRQVWGDHILPDSQGFFEVPLSLGQIFILVCLEQKNVGKTALKSEKQFQLTEKFPVGPISSKN